MVDQVHGEYEKNGNLILNNNHLTLIMVDNLLDLEQYPLVGGGPTPLKNDGVRQMGV